ncbi:Alpha-galactosidase [Acidisarcina polymorpha]|uniref:Alpha-galactosidase n=1 Tax=Acidisarcina polymorpha TaxID=2211140 RepID=A0A2Z5FSJ8_9BACT|nr:alpha-galactosidase [Acidisarcina polymorpha]AXC09783.1 Alpha-galactosidase [Acidisarcina polymorpha]
MRNSSTIAVRWCMAALLAGSSLAARGEHTSSYEGALKIGVDPTTGRYTIARPASDAYTLQAGAAVQVDGTWLHASDYPHHTIKQSKVDGLLGKASEWEVTYSGIKGKPDLTYHLRAYSDQAFGDVLVTVRNTTNKMIHIGGIRSVDATDRDSTGGRILDLGGPPAEDRVLSDSWSEDRPGMTIHNLADSKQQMHRAVGSQLIYNLQSHESLFLGALTSERFLTVLRLHLVTASGGEPSLSSYEGDSTGTTELQMENSLEHSPAEDQVPLSLPLDPGAELSSERVLFSVSKDYHHQLDTYASLIREIHHARTSAPPLMGWWSWTAYYFGLNQGAALTNAQWEAEHLKSLGYNIFHIDEGYQYARGEYSTPNVTLFPDGLAPLYYKVNRLGLTPGIWTAPFEVSERSWVYQNHPEWLVKNEKGQPIHAGSVEDEKDQLFVLDTTNPAAQDYLRKTYSTLVNDWGVRYIKMDFMDDSAIEGYYYKPNTTALEAQRIGLQTIRDTVGNDVYLDKDGSAMLNPVGFVDYGRISQDTGHTFSASKEAATGIAARYYMNRNYFVADPDAFTVSTQTIQDRTWHESTKPATLDEAEVSISLAAVSGGMFEIGDNLTSLTKDPVRLALIENPDLIQMIRLGKASVPIDLMTYAVEDEQPSIFLLKEDRRQSMLTVFDWTDKQRAHSIDLSAIGLPAAGHHYVVTDVLDTKEMPTLSGGILSIQQPAHSVRVLKIIDTSVPATGPTVEANHPSDGKAGAVLRFSARSHQADPVISYRWDFGDGVTSEGIDVEHTYTESGEYHVVVTATGLGGESSQDRFHIRISGHMPTTFDPSNIMRPRSTKE